MVYTLAQSRKLLLLKIVQLYHSESNPVAVIVLRNLAICYFTYSTVQQRRGPNFVPVMVCCMHLGRLAALVTGLVRINLAVSELCHARQRLYLQSEMIQRMPYRQSRHAGREFHLSSSHHSQKAYTGLRSQKHCLRLILQSFRPRGRLHVGLLFHGRTLHEYQWRCEYLEKEK